MGGKSNILLLLWLMNEEVATNDHHFITVLQLTYCENQITMCVGYEERLKDKAISKDDDI